MYTEIDRLKKQLLALDLDKVSKKNIFSQLDKINDDFSQVNSRMYQANNDNEIISRLLSHAIKRLDESHFFNLNTSHSFNTILHKETLLSKIAKELSQTLDASQKFKQGLEDKPDQQLSQLQAQLNKLNKQLIDFLDTKENDKFVSSNQWLLNLKQDDTNWQLPAQWRNKKFIYIEDNKANRFFVKQLFEKWNLKLEMADNILLGHSLLESAKFDCILTDLQLPDGNGYEQLMEKRKDPNFINKDTPVIVMTATKLRKSVIQEMEITQTDLLYKPFDPKKLFNKIKTAVDHGPAINIDPHSYDNNRLKIKDKQLHPNHLIKHLKKLFTSDESTMEMIDILTEQIPTSVKNIGNQIVSKNIKGVKYESHKLKSSIRISGLNNLFNMINNINNLSQSENNFEIIKKLYSPLEKQAIKDIQLLLKAHKILKAQINQENTQLHTGS